MQQLKLGTVFRSTDRAGRTIRHTVVVIAKDGVTLRGPEGDRVISLEQTEALVKMGE